MKSTIAKITTILASVCFVLAAATIVLATRGDDDDGHDPVISHATCEEVLVVMPQAPDELDGTSGSLSVSGSSGDTNVSLSWMGYFGNAAKWAGTVSSLGEGEYTIDSGAVAGRAIRNVPYEFELECGEDPTPTPTPTDDPPDDPPAPPNFPACLTFTEPGDWQHYDSGVHQIVGGGLVEGRDDVYTVGENYVQCFCPSSGQGTQTNWWRTESILAGWFSETGSQWNLGDGHFLAQNSEYDCSVSEPTPTPTPTSPPPPPPPDNPPTCPASSPTASPVLGGFRSSPTSVVLTWNSVGPLTHYSLRYGTSSGNYQYGATNIGNGILYEVKDLQPGVTYYFQITGVNDCAAGHWSNEFSPGQVLGAVTHEPVAAGIAGMGFQLLAAGLAALGAVFYALSRFTKRIYILDR